MTRWLQQESSSLAKFDAVQKAFAIGDDRVWDVLGAWLWQVLQRGDDVGERSQDVIAALTLECTLPTGCPVTTFSLGGFMDANVCSRRRVLLLYRVQFSSFVNNRYLVCRFGYSILE